MSKEEIEQYGWDNNVLSRKDVYDLVNDVFKEKRLTGVFNISASKELYQFNSRLRKLTYDKAKEILNQNKKKMSNVIGF